MKTGSLNVISSLLEDPCNDLVERAIDEGYIPIGYTCSYVPHVLLSVDKLLPLRLRAPAVAGTEMADTYLSPVICSYTRSILEYTMDRKFDFLRGWVFTSSCDHMRRLFDNIKYLEKPDFFHLIDLPRKCTDRSVAWLREELEKLKGLLEEKFQISITDDSISKAIGEENEKRRFLKEIGDLRKREYPPITGAEFHSLMLTSVTTPWKLLFPLLEDLKHEIMGREGISDYRARLLLVGGQMDDPAYIEAIESQGALVVADRICTGSIPGLEEISGAGDPLEVLARDTLENFSCPRMMGNFDDRLNLILRTIEEFRIDGVIIEVIKFCDLWGVELPLLIKRLREKGIPVLRLEREYSMGGEGQLKTRVQAFLESMGK